MFCPGYTYNGSSKKFHKFVKSNGVKVFRTEQIREIDAWTIGHEPVASIDLMERAAKACSDWITSHVGLPREVLVFCGPGNNGGDGLALARLLYKKYYRVKVFIVAEGSRFSPDFLLNRKRLEELHSVEILQIEEMKSFPDIKNNAVVIDALFGTGLSRPVTGLPAEVICLINQAGVPVISVDLPSGLFAENNQENDTCTIVKASHTLTFQFPKLAFFFGNYREFTGNWHILPIGLDKDYISSKETDLHYLLAEEVSGMLHERPKFSHKGTYGHALLIAGCHGMMGAAVLAARACLKAGAGLVTTHVPRFGVNIVQTCVPESLISIDESDTVFTLFPDLDRFSAVGVGPAINCRPNAQEGLQALLRSCKVPLVIDADAINILGQRKEWIELIPEGSILTPHPKEFERLVGRFDDPYERNRKQLGFAQAHRVYVVLKGAYTAIACPDGSCWFNSTGNPGMATGGSGDVLTGIILSLLAQSYTPREAALLGTYIHGLAGDFAAMSEGEEGMLASDITDHIGKAILKLKKKSDEI